MSVSVGVGVRGAGVVCSMGSSAAAVLAALDVAAHTVATQRSVGTPRAAGFQPGDLPGGIGRRLGRQPALALAAILDALGGRTVAADTALVLGTAFGATAETAEFIRGFALHGAAVSSPLLFSNSLHHTMAGVAGRTLGTRGPAIVVCNGTATFESALLVATAMIRNGRVERVIVAASDALDAVADLGMRRVGLLPEVRADDDRAAGAPFRGFAAGEGAGALLLEACAPDAPGVGLANVARGAACSVQAGDVESVQWLATGGARSIESHRAAWERLAGDRGAGWPPPSMPAAHFGTFASLGAVAIAVEAARRLRQAEPPRGRAVFLQVPYGAPQATAVLTGNGLGA